MSSKDKDFLNSIRKELDDSCDQVDGATLSKLNQARQAAIEAKAKRPGWLIPVSGFAATASVAVLSINLWTTEVANTPQIDFVEDVELLSNSEDLEFYQNLDFYQWLEDEKPIT